jgi:hypothetical protein
MENKEKIIAVSHDGKTWLPKIFVMFSKNRVIVIDDINNYSCTAYEYYGSIQDHFELF